MATISENLRCLLENSDKSDVTKFFLLIVISVLASGLEVVSVGALLPVLNVLFVENSEVFYFKFFDFGLDKTNSNTAVILVISIFVCITLLSTVVKVLHIYLTNLFTFKLGGKIAIKIYNKILKMDYLEFQTYSQSDVLSTLVYRSYSLTSGFLNPLVIIFSSLCLLIGMLILVVLNLRAEIISIAIFAGLIYLMIALGIAKKMTKLSAEINDGATKTLHEVNEGLGNIKSIILADSQSYYVGKYNKEETRYRHAKFLVQMYSALPRNLVEAAVLVLTALLLLVLTINGVIIDSMVPSLGVMAITFQKSLPHLQAVFGNVNILRSERDSVTALIGIFGKSLKKRASAITANANENPIPLMQKGVKLKNVVFNYPNRRETRVTIDSLTIEKGKKYAVIGASGSGKTTFLDLIIGLIPLEKGQMTVDGVEVDDQNISQWRNQIAYVPQTLFLASGSVLDNICASPSDQILERKKLKDAVRFASFDFVLENDKLDETKLNLDLGENAKRLSGGQRIRLAIVKAIYQGQRVLVFDEATGALDRETAQRIVRNITKLSEDYTVVFATHSHEGLELFDKVITIENQFIMSKQSVMQN